MNKYVSIFDYQLALYLQNEGWVVHHTAPNKNNSKRKVYYFSYCPGICDDIEKFQNIKEGK